MEERNAEPGHLSGLDNGPVVVCVPAFNEEKTIAKVIIKARKYGSVLVCDDGSTDMTGEIASALAAVVIRNERNLGKGGALRGLIEQAKLLHPSVVVTIDADLQHDPDDIPKLVEPVANGAADLVIGARQMISGSAPTGRIMGNRLLDAMMNTKTGERIRDTQSGFRAYSSSALEMVKFLESGMSVESQTLIDAIKSGLRIKEVPVSTTYHGIRRKRNPLNHLSEIVDYLVTRTVVDSPLLYLGVPGLSSAIIGIIVGIRVLDIFDRTHEVAIGSGLIAVGLIVIGVVLMAASLIVKLMRMSVAR